MNTQVNWSREDLRIRDPRPLAEAASQGTVLCLFLYEPYLDEEPELQTNRPRVIKTFHREFSSDGDASRSCKRGETGYFMVHACMRALYRSGWINFRAHALLVSFSSYHLWQHGCHPGELLVHQLLDHEPGINWPQMQMQSGTTGIHSIQIFNLSKQNREYDPEGGHPGIPVRAS